MSEKASNAADTAGQDLVITRVFAAPRELVFKAHTEVGRLTRWWGPRGFTMLRSTLQLRPGGAFHYCMRSPDGQELWGKLVYREIIPPERLAFVVSFSDEQGNTARNPFSADWPLEVLNILTFSEHDGRTTLTLRGRPINATDSERDAFAAGHDSVRLGMGLSLDQLAEYLASVHVDRGE